MKLSIITPIYNEEKNIDEFYKRLSLALKKHFYKWKYEIVFIDDGSNDSSYVKLTSLHKKDKKVKILQFTKNYGQHNAILAGLQEAKGDFIVVMDSDLQDRPEEIITLYKKLLEGFNIVYSVRNRYDATFFKKTTSKFFWSLLSFFTGMYIPPDQSMLKIFDTKILKQVNAIQEATPFLPVIFAKAGMKQGTQGVKNDKRYRGKSKYTIDKLLHLTAIALFYYSFKRTSYLLFTSIGFLQLLSIWIFVLKNSYVNVTDVIVLQIAEFILIIIFVRIAAFYFSLNTKNDLPNACYEIKRKILR